METAFILADIDLMQLALVCGVGFIVAVLSGISGYGAGLVLPVFLAPLVGVTNVIPVMSISMMMINITRVIAFWQHIDWQHSRLLLLVGLPTCVAGAWGYTLLSSRWVALLLGLFLIISVPLRRVLHKSRYQMSTTVECTVGAVYGFLSGGMAGTGVILVSILISAGLPGMAIIATDGIVAMAMAITKIILFSSTANLGWELAAVGLMIGMCTAPSSFIARKLITIIPVKVHAWVMEAMVVVGGIMLVWQATWDTGTG